MRSPIAFFLVPFMCVWSGFSLGGIYGSQIVKGHFQLGPSLFGIPFLIGTLVFGSIALLSVAGRSEVRVRGEHAEAFTGVGPLGLRRRFLMSEVTRVREDVVGYSNSTPIYAIVLEGSRRIRVGVGVSDARRQFMFGVLRALVEGKA
jgi:hypothetical protein